MTVTTADEVYEQIVKQLSAQELLRLADKINRSLSVARTKEALPSQPKNGHEALQRMVEVSEEMGLYDE